MIERGTNEPGGVASHAPGMGIGSRWTARMVRRIVLPGGFVVPIWVLVLATFVLVGGGAAAALVSVAMRPTITPLDPGSPAGGVVATTPAPTRSPAPASQPPPASTRPTPSADSSSASPNDQAATAQPALPVRAAFYYPWFPEAWTQQGFDPFTEYEPSAGLYDSSDPDVVRRHLEAMEYGHVDVGIASWWGAGDDTDARLPTLLDAASGTDFRWSVYHEVEGSADPSATVLAEELTYLRDRYGGEPTYFRIDDRFVVFVYADGDDRCEMVDRWTTANAEIGAYLVLKVFPGYASCPAQPDGWHQYAPANATEFQEGYSFAISPGFDRPDEPARLARDLERWDGAVREMVASGAPFQLVVSFNEWGEGTSVEPAAEWESASGYGSYLDVLHEHETRPTVAQPPSASPTTPAPTPSSGTPSPTAGTPTPAPSAPVVAGSEVVIRAAGDIACHPGDEDFDGGAGTEDRCQHGATAALLEGADAVIALGDIQYEEGELDAFRESYDPTWGAFKGITLPAVGNHEYLTDGADGYFDYFGSRAGARDEGYYVLEMAGWRVYGINSNCSQAGGCSEDDPMYEWLAADLEANPTACALAFMHHPRWSSGKYQVNDDVRSIVGLLDEGGVDVMLAGHAHNYERFAPQTTEGTADPEGIRAFVVGTGGRNLTDVDVEVQANSEVRNDTTFGVLELTLRDGAYDWRFLPVPGGEFTDAGTEECR